MSCCQIMSHIFSLTPDDGAIGNTTTAYILIFLFTQSKHSEIRRCWFIQLYKVLKFNKNTKNPVKLEDLPVPVFSFDLVDRDVQRPVRSLADGQRLVDPKLCRRHRLTLRQRRQVEAKLLPVRTRLQQVALLLHYKERGKGQRFLGLKQTKNKETLELSVCRNKNLEETF